MKRPLLFAAAAVVVPSLFVSLVAIADVIPFTPSCPPGQVVEMNHGGSFCVGVPPKNCPAGWTGVRGTPMSKTGNCVLRTCEDQRGCSDGLECKPADLCIEERTVPIFQRDSPVGKRNAFFTSDLCSADAGSTCVAPATCRPSGVCLPKNVAKAAPRPANGKEGEGAGPRNAAAKSASPPVTPPSATASVAPTATLSNDVPTTSTPPTTTTAPPPTTSDASIDNTPKDTAPRSGCSGCNIGASESAGTLACATMGALAFGFARRRRKKTSR